MEEVHLIYIGIAALIICLILTVFLLLVYSGLFHSIEIGAGKPPIGDVVVAYKFARGPYSESGQLFTELMAVAPDNKALGVYYDDPKKVKAGETRYIVATILAEGEEPVDENLKSKLLEEGYLITRFPAVENAVKTSFPQTCTISIYIAVARVYPRLSGYIIDNKLCAHPFLEIYDGKTINYMAPLCRQEEFYVPETKTVAGSDDSFISEETCTEDDVSSMSDLTDKSPSFKTVQRDAVSSDQTESNTPTSTLLPNKGDYSDGDKIKEGEASSSMNDSGVSSQNQALPDSSLDGLGKSEVAEAGSDHSEGSSFEEIHLDQAGL